MSINTVDGYYEYLSIVQDSRREIYWQYNLTFQIDSAVITPFKVLSLYQSHDFVRKWHCDFFVSVLLDRATYRRMVRNKSKIKVRLWRNATSPLATVVDETDRDSIDYNAFITEVVDSGLIGGEGEGEVDNTETLSQLSGGLFSVTLQLVPDYVDYYRMVTNGGVFTDSTIEGILAYLMLRSENAYVTLGSGVNKSGNSGIETISIVPPDNNHTFKQLIVPFDTKLIDVPKILQKKYGIYSTGLGWQFYNSKIYVYPLLNFGNRGVTQNSRRLSIINIPKQEFPVLDCTYTVKGNEYIILATGDTEQSDQTERVQSSLGTGVAVIPASKMLDYYSTTSANITTVSKDASFKTFVLDEKRFDRQNVHVSKKRITNNIYEETAPLVAGLGTKVRVRWDRSAPELLEPGMKVYYYYKDGTELERLEGTLIGVETTITPETDLATDKNYICTTILDLYLKRMDYDI